MVHLARIKEGGRVRGKRFDYYALQGGAWGEKKRKGKKRKAAKRRKRQLEKEGES